MSLPEKDFKIVQSTSHLELILTGLEKTEELHYLSFLAKKQGFRISNEWTKTRDQISEDILNPNSLRPEVTLINLEKLVDQLIISADHSYRVYSVDNSMVSKIRNLPSKISDSYFNSQLSALYPAKLDPATIVASGVALTKIKTLDSGIAFIFSVIDVSTTFDQNSHQLITSIIQSFNTVFIPEGSERIEVRITNKVKKNDRDECFRKVLESFHNLVGTFGVDLRSLNQYCFYNSIDSYYLDSAVGRASSIIMTTNEDSNDAVLSNRRNRNYCARTQSVVDDSGKNHKYTCRAVSIRWPLENENRCECELSIEPHKHTWEMGHCYTFEIKHPSSLAHLNRLVDDVINRA
jgi:hypothetical protein